MPEANMHMDKRVYPRIAVKIPVVFSLVEDQTEIQNLKNQKADTVDISLGGMAISLDKPLEKGAVLRVNVSLPNLPKPLTFFAEVVRINPTNAGLQFIMVKPQDIEALKSYIDKAGSSPA